VNLKTQRIETFVAAAVFLAFPVAANATVLTFTAQGTITNVDAPLAGQFAPGNIATFTISYDTSVVDFQGDPQVGGYLGAALSGSGQVGSFAFTLGPGDVSVADNKVGIDFFGIGQPASGPTISGYNVVGLGIDLTDPTATALSSDAMPTALDASLFSSKAFFLNFASAAAGGAGISGVITDATLAQTPIPATLSLFASGLGLLGFLSQRRKRK
jgi:hypothetical protein